MASSMMQSVPLTTAVHPCLIRSTDRACFLNTTPISRNIGVSSVTAAPAFSPALLKSLQRQQQSSSESAAAAGGCWDIPELWFPPQSRLEEIDPKNGQRIQATDLMALSGKDRVIFPTCLYGSCEREVESELIRDLKAACWEQGSFELSTQERTGQTARRSLTLRLRMRCANHTAKRGCCPFQFTVFWHVQKQYWYYTPPPHAHLKLSHATTCLPLGAGAPLMVPSPIVLPTGQPQRSLASSPTVGSQTSKSNKRNVIKKGAVPTLQRKGPYKKLAPSSSSDRITLDSCLEITPVQKNIAPPSPSDCITLDSCLEMESKLPVQKNLAPSSPSDRITLDACLATATSQHMWHHPIPSPPSDRITLEACLATTQHLWQHAVPTTIPKKKQLAGPSSPKSQFSLEFSQTTTAAQKQATSSGSGPCSKKQVPHNTSCKKFPPPSCHRAKPKAPSPDDRVTLASVCSSSSKRPAHKRIFSDDLSVFFQNEQRQGFSAVDADDLSMSSRGSSSSMPEVAQAFAVFLQEDIMSVSTSMTSFSRNSSISSWDEELPAAAAEIALAIPAVGAQSRTRPLLWDDLDFAAPQA